MIRLTKSSATATQHLEQIALMMAIALVACSSGFPATASSDVDGVRFSLTGRRFLLQAPSPASEEISALSIPAQIAVPAGGQSTLLGAIQGVGYQHYSFNGTAWVLYNVTGWLHRGNGSSVDSVVGAHFFLAQPDAKGGQPSWQLGGRVTAKSVAAVAVDSDSITWNLLQATSYQLAVSDNNSTSGEWSWLADVTHVQRLATQRGLPPASTS